MTTKRDKVRAQVKSRWYYFFWSSCTISVLLGQLYVGNGYRMYSKPLMRLFQQVEFELKGPRGYYAPLVPAEPTGPHEFQYLKH